MRTFRFMTFVTLLGLAAVVTGCPCGESVQGELTSFSGRFGYFVEGPWGFQGALTKENLDDPEWKFEGTFQFPSSGYFALPPAVEVLESSPEQVHITLNVMTPLGDQAVLPVITPVTIRTTAIAASDEAVFDVRFAPMCIYWPATQE